MKVNVIQLAHTLSNLNVIPQREGQVMYIRVSESLPTIGPVGDEGREYKGSKALQQIMLIAVSYRQGNHTWYEWEMEI